MSKANLPRSSIAPLEQLSSTGIYFGFAKLHPIPSSSSTTTPSTSKSSADPAQPKQSTSTKEKKESSLSVETISSLPGKTASYPEAQTQGKENDRLVVEVEKHSKVEVQERPEGTDEEVGQAGSGLKEEDYGAWPMVMSVGYNPYYGNKEMTAVSSFYSDVYACKLPC